MTRAERRQKRCCLRSDLSAGPARACLPAEVPAGYQPTTGNTYTHTQTNTHCFLVAISRTWNESHLIEPPVMNANTTYLWLIMEPGVFHKEDQNCQRKRILIFLSFRLSFPSVPSTSFWLAVTDCSVKFLPHSAEYDDLYLHTEQMQPKEKKQDKCRKSYKPQCFGRAECGGGTLATTEKQTLIKDGSANNQRLPFLTLPLFSQPPGLHIPDVCFFSTSM